jgi:hypothetical protein
MPGSSWDVDLTQPTHLPEGPLGLLLTDTCPSGMRGLHLFILPTFLLVFLVYTYLPTRHPSPSPSPNPKYFHESATNGHLDGRFANPEHLPVSMTPLIQSYLHAMASLGIETWLAHGTLLGWYWGKRVLPWDNDGDAHISVESLETIVNHGHNMSVYERYPEGPQPHTGQYLLDINPHWKDQRVGSPWQDENRIDARFVDMSNGAFIDVTAVTTVVSHRCTFLVSRDGHRYPYDSVFPLQLSSFEDMAAYVPSQPERLLREEYGQEALEREVFRG